MPAVSVTTAMPALSFVPAARPAARPARNRAPGGALGALGADRGPNASTRSPAEHTSAASATTSFAALPGCEAARTCAPTTTPTPSIDSSAAPSGRPMHQPPSRATAIHPTARSGERTSRWRIAIPIAWTSSESAG